MAESSYTKPGSVKVDDVFKDIKGAICPFLPGSAFKTIEEMLASFDEPDRLRIVRYSDGFYGHLELK